MFFFFFFLRPWTNRFLLLHSWNGFGKVIGWQNNESRNVFWKGFNKIQIIRTKLSLCIQVSLFLFVQKSFIVLVFNSCCSGLSLYVLDGKFPFIQTYIFFISTDVWVCVFDQMFFFFIVCFFLTDSWYGLFSVVFLMEEISLEKNGEKYKF